MSPGYKGWSIRQLWSIPQGLLSVEKTNSSVTGPTHSLTLLLILPPPPLSQGGWGACLLEPTGSCLCENLVPSFKLTLVYISKPSISTEFFLSDYRDLKFLLLLKNSSFDPSFSSSYCPVFLFPF